MPDEQVIEQETTETASTEDSSSDDAPLASFLSQFSTAKGAQKVADPEPEEAEAEADKPAGKEKGDKTDKPSRPRVQPAPAVDDEEAFSEKALSTPEGLKRARELIEERNRKSTSTWAQVSKRLEKLQAKKDQFLTERAQVVQFRDQLFADVKAIRSGSPKERIEAFGRLCGGDGHELFEQFSVELATGGKPKPPDPEVVKLRQELEQMRFAQAKREEQEREHHFHSQKETLKDQIVETVLQDPESWPTLTAYAEDNRDEVREALASILTQYHAQHGRPLPWGKAADILEQTLETKLSRLDELRARRQGAPQGVSGLETRARAKPDQALSPPPKPRGRSLAPGLTQRSGETRPATADDQDPANFFPPEFLEYARSNG